MTRSGRADALAVVRGATVALLLSVVAMATLWTTAGAAVAETCFDGRQFITCPTTPPSTAPPTTAPATTAPPTTAPPTTAPPTTAPASPTTVPPATTTPPTTAPPSATTTVTTVPPAPVPSATVPPAAPTTVPAPQTAPLTTPAQADGSDALPEGARAIGTPAPDSGGGAMSGRTWMVLMAVFIAMLRLAAYIAGKMERPEP